MRNALFFLSLSMLANAFGILGMPLGVLLAVAIFVGTFWWVLVHGGKTIFHLLAFILITTILLKGVVHSSFGRHMQVTVTICSIILIFAFAGTSREIDIAPSFAIFVAVMLFLRTFIGIAVPEKLSWSIIAFLMIASHVDDWNLRHRPFEEKPEEEYLSE